MDCPVCEAPMTPSAAGPHFHCGRCQRMARPGDTSIDVEMALASHEAAVSMLEEVMDELEIPYGPRPGLGMCGSEGYRPVKERDEMSGIQTRGCPKDECAGTQWKTVETDENGMPTSETQWVCGSCGRLD